MKLKLLNWFVWSQKCTPTSQTKAIIILFFKRFTINRTADQLINFDTLKSSVCRDRENESMAVKPHLINLKTTPAELILKRNN